MSSSPGLMGINPVFFVPVWIYCYRMQILGDF
ncbi:hypothetical protein Cop2CBH44_19550 [Coprobacter secundus subsp. similis]|uniref:Uncharacterized protein n=1 Tax=Coprobacter secundus subsp. similis TaxID=2751153 RepID=A0A7G1HXQ5_9BACT|nr:hypothetical protein Cop2CBH44_19550 [Coprobacter secundus subsp. similis]